MKKLSLLACASLGLLLGACASEEPFGDNEVAAGGESNVPMSFDFHVTNQTRTDANLETVHKQFGVWAFKGASESSFAKTSTTLNVMNDYMVGYWDSSTNNGYKPENGQAPTTKWYYEGLGTSDVKTGTSDPAYKYLVDGADGTGVASHLANQYLKYWDAGQKYTYFYGYAPYSDASDNAIATFTKANAGDKATLTFPEITAATGSDYMYALTRELNAPHVSAGNEYKVDMKFQRLASQIRLAFYEEIEGYDVEIIDYNQTAGSGVVFVPSNGLDNTTVTYTSQATPVVEFQGFTDDGAGTTMAGKNDVKVTYTGATSSSENFVWKAATGTDGFTALKLGTTYADRIFSDVKQVVPADKTDGKANCGFTLNVSFKLTAHGTGEVIYVYGARVFVGGTHTQWKPNCRYTYVFRITKDLPGATGNNNPTIDPKPNPNPALYPIIFNNVVVSDWDEDLNSTEGDTEFDVL